MSCFQKGSTLVIWTTLIETVKKGLLELRIGSLPRGRVYGLGSNLSFILLCFLLMQKMGCSIRKICARMLKSLYDEDSARSQSCEHVRKGPFPVVS